MTTPLKDARRVVVKIGSSLLTNAGAGLDREAIADWALQIGELRASGIEVLVANTVMRTLEDRTALARAVLAFAQTIRERRLQEA